MPFTLNDIKQIADFFHLFKVREKFGVYYQNIAFIGIFCLFLSYLSARNLLIPIRTLVYLALATSALFSTIFINFYRRELGILWAFFHNMTLGLISIYLFIQSNDLFSSHEAQTNTYIIEKLEIQNETLHHYGSYLAPYVTIKIENNDIRLRLSTSDLNDVQKTKRIKIGVKKGFWNYPIIKSIQLPDNE
ncbi:hypothetical protein HXX01_05095 [Candidatus Nomurabacteria bacterium]|nr:hypothetical protein [Candidatus Nomurabacteria bacterium]